MKTWIDLGEPEPLPPFAPYEPLEWEQTDRVLQLGPLNSVEDQVSLEFSERRTRYDFGPVTLHQLGQLLGVVCAVRRIGHEEYGFRLTQRGAPSAGGIHPIHLLVHLPSHAGWYRYDPYKHALNGVFEGQDPWKHRQDINRIVDGQNGALFVLVAEPGFSSSKYRNPCSLIWRDAGVLLGYLSLVATAQRLSFCPLGTTAGDVLRGLVEHDRLCGVGAAFVGSRS